MCIDRNPIALRFRGVWSLVEIFLRAATPLCFGSPYFEYPLIEWGNLKGVRSAYRSSTSHLLTPNPLELNPNHSSLLSFRSWFWPIDAVWNLNQPKFVQYLSISSMNATAALHANLEIEAIFHSSSCSCTC
jgi:hypothetical protein